MKLAMIFESDGNFKDALEIYKTIKTDFKDSNEASGIEKFIARAENR